MNDGYVKYTAEHTTTTAIEASHWEELNEARTFLHKLGVVGITPEGIGFGNLSIRYEGNSFLITGTATGALLALSPGEYCLVRSFDIEKNHVVTSGPLHASAESMTHGAVYESCPAANCVIHIHSRAIFDGMIREHYTATPANAEYGSPEMAAAISKCVKEIGKEEGSIVMTGHDEGVIAYAASVKRALELILELINKF